MNIQLKTIISKEMKVMQSKRYLITLLFGFIILSLIVYYLCDSLHKTDYTLITKSIVQAMTLFLIFVTVFTFMIQYLAEINREKIDKRIEFMLTLPISIFNIIYGKLIFILFSYYMISLCSIIIITIILGYFQMSILQFLTIETWLTILIIIPLFMVLYSSITIWLSLRFNSNIIAIYNILTYITFILAFFLGKYVNKLEMLNFLTDGFAKGNVITHSILLYSALILVMGFIVMYIIIKRLNKEKIIN